MPMPSSVIASSPEVTCSPEATTASYSRASCSAAAARHQVTSWLVVAGHGRHHHGDLMAGVDLALDMARHVADAIDIGDRGSAEFHHKPGHSGCASQATDGGRPEPDDERRPKKARIHTGGVPGLQPRRPVNHARAAMAPKPQRQSNQGTVDPAEVERFSALAAEWWDPRGKMAPLHKFNPVRIGYIRDRAAARFDRDPKRLDSLKGLRILDIGCGGGLLSEPLARLGADMVGVDPSETNIEAAKQHAALSELPIDYRCTTAEDLAEAREQFDIVLAMEVVEHVADVPLFVQSCAEMVRPGGLMIAATINRTLKSFALAIVGAEYILRWLPVGSHRWDKFVTPNELEIAMEQGGLRVIARAGRDLQYPRRPLAALDRHGRQLHARRRKAGLRPAGGYPGRAQ